MIRDLEESNELAPPLKPRPGVSPIAPVQRTQTLATGKPAPVVKAKHQQQSEAADPFVVQVNQRANAGLSHSVGQAVGALQQLKQQRQDLKETLMQEFAVALSPELFLQEVQMGAAMLLSQSQTSDLDFDFFSGAREQLAQLEPAKPFEVDSQLQAWLDDSEAKRRDAVDAIAATVMTDAQ